MSYIQDKLNMRRRTDTGFKIWDFPQKSTIKVKFETEWRSHNTNFANSDAILARQNDSGLRQQWRIHQHFFF